MLLYCKKLWLRAIDPLKSCSSKHSLPGETCHAHEKWTKEVKNENHPVAFEIIYFIFYFFSSL